LPVQTKRTVFIQPCVDPVNLSARDTLVNG
jgi:hypothetical protein